MPPQLNKDLILSSDYQDRDDLEVPAARQLDLPEKVLQFGTGRFLRGFADYFIDRANRQQLFGGRVIMVSSTGSGRSELFDQQDGLYTLCIQGLEEGEAVERRSVLGSVSRALAAPDEWSEVLRRARSSRLEIIISNTTEVGIQLDEDDAIDLDPPRSYPGKLTAFLYERAKTFKYDPSAGLLILPCELIEGNGDELKSIVLELADRWKLGEAFTEWVKEANTFCNTLVDRIVTGWPGDEAINKHQEELGYADELFTVAEVYRLWAIEGEKEQIPFADADEGIVVADDITPYRDRKVRILNGTHTSTVPAAFLSGHETILDAMRGEHTSDFIRRTMMEDIVPSLDVEGGRAFAEDVLERFANPYLKHRLIDITFQITSKMRPRVVPSLRRYWEKHNALPQHLCFGFACYLRFMRGREARNGVIYGQRDDEQYPIRDDHADHFMEAWQRVKRSSDLPTFVQRICAEEAFWGTDLNELPGFADTVTRHLQQILDEGAAAVLETHLQRAAQPNG